LKFTSNLATPIANTTHNLILTGSTAGTGEFAGVLINPNIGYTTTITKNGSGTWTLSAANANTGGVFTVNGGALVLNNATAILGGIGASGGLSALTFNGGVIGLGNGDFTRSLAAAGTVTGVNFAGNGGWAAYGADRLVNLGGALATITWATASTGFNAKTLILGNATATHTVDLQNSLDLGSTAETVQTDNGAAAIDGKLSGIITGIAGGNLSKTGLGTLALTATNTYTGTTTVSAGTLLLNGSISNGVVTVNSGATLGGSGAIGGNVTFSSGSSAVFTPGSTLAIAGTLSTVNNVVHLNLPAKLAGGVYILATYKSAGSTGTFATVPVADTGTLPDGATIITESGVVKLNVPLKGTLISFF
jgi:autotransporter-associated beta strand protein